MQRPATIIDVANTAGVSTATVSRVINGGLVKESTKRLVEETIERLGYRRNGLARGLVTGRTGFIGVLVPDITGPLYAQLARGIEDILEPRAMNYLMVTDNRDVYQERQSIALLIERQIDTLIIIGSQLSEAELDKLVPEDIPVVLVQREQDEARRLQRFSRVEIDNRVAVEEIVDYLVALGHKRIAHVAGTRREGMLREQVFKERLTHHGLEALAFLRSSDSQGDENTGIKAAASVLDLIEKEQLSAVFCANDRIAVGLYHALQQEGIAIPETLSVVGFDDLPWSRYLHPPLTTVRQDARAMGQKAAIASLEMLSAVGGGTQNILLPTELIYRSSVTKLLAASPREVLAPKGGDW